MRESGNHYEILIMNISIEQSVLANLIDIELYVFCFKGRRLSTHDVLIIIMKNAESNFDKAPCDKKLSDK